jgi:hypothetical protein
VLVDSIEWGEKKIEINGRILINNWKMNLPYHLLFL